MWIQYFPCLLLVIANYIANDSDNCWFLNPKGMAAKVWDPKACYLGLSFEFLRGTIHVLGQSIHSSGFDCVLLLDGGEIGIRISISLGRIVSSYLLVSYLHPFRDLNPAMKHGHL